MVRFKAFHQHGRWTIDNFYLEKGLPVRSCILQGEDRGPYGPQNQNSHDFQNQREKRACVQNYLDQFRTIHIIKSFKNYVELSRSTFLVSHEM